MRALPTRCRPSTANGSLCLPSTRSANACVSFFMSVCKTIRVLNRVTQPDVAGPLTREMQLLPEHVGRDERQSATRHPETALPIRVVIFADNRAVRDH